ncbi:sucrase ferredoxin [Corynebacterium resistens]|uniref:sucrase ferredoxin n=1 Tax=Corynebacterium resistens TaxID=258224 RepID=UPI0023547701|nr:sucrase ferredoxin [Corynebacterium resistens]
MANRSDVLGKAYWKWGAPGVDATGTLVDMSTKRNPAAGNAASSPERGDAKLEAAIDNTPVAKADLCAKPTAEKLPGTAKNAKLVLAVEFFRGWGKDILDGEALGDELAGELKKFLKANKAELHFIRRPGRAGQDREKLGTRQLFIAWADAERAGYNPEEPYTPILEEMQVASTRDLLDLDLSRPGANAQAKTVDRNILLVCTHARRDRCCAIFGRPVAAELSKDYDEVWESSHTKGHRFAPSMILLPSNYSFGRLTSEEARHMLDGAREQHLTFHNNRGRGTLTPPAQVAELQVARQLLGQGFELGLNDFASRETSSETARDSEGNKTKAVTVEVKHFSSQRTFRVHLVQSAPIEVLTSCGEPPKPQRGWKTTILEEC